MNQACFKIEKQYDLHRRIRLMMLLVKAEYDGYIIVYCYNKI